MIDSRTERRDELASWVTTSQTTSQTEATDELRRRGNSHICNTLRHLTEIVSAIDNLDSAWHLASERNIDERAALDAARRQLASLLDGSAVAQ